MRITAVLLLCSAVASLPLSDESRQEAADVSDQVGELEQKIEELLDNSDMTPEELADLLNEDIDSEEVEYIVEAVDEGLVVSLQEKQALFYPDLDYTEDSSEEVDAESEEEDDDEEKGEESEDDEEVEGVPLEDLLAEEEDELVEYDYTLLETSDSMIVVLDADAPSSEELDYVVEEDARSEMMEEKLFLEVDAIASQVELDEAVKYDHFNDDRKIFEIVIMSGIAMTCLMFIFGLAALISSYLAPQTPPTVTIAALPKPTQMTSSSGGIIRQYTRVPVEIKNMLPSNVAYKQLYET